MSDDFGKGVKFQPLPVTTHKEMLEMFPDHAHLANADYNRLLKDYFGCVTGYLNDFYEPQVLEQ